MEGITLPTTWDDVPITPSCAALVQLLANEKVPSRYRDTDNITRGFRQMALPPKDFITIGSTAGDLVEHIVVVGEQPPCGQCHTAGYEPFVLESGFGGTREQATPLRYCGNGCWTLSAMDMFTTELPLADSAAEAKLGPIHRECVDLGPWKCEEPGQRRIAFSTLQEMYTYHRVVNRSARPAQLLLFGAFVVAEKRRKLLEIFADLDHAFMRKRSRAFVMLPCALAPASSLCIDDRMTVVNGQPACVLVLPTARECEIYPVREVDEITCTLPAAYHAADVGAPPPSNVPLFTLYASHSDGSTKSVFFRMTQELARAARANAFCRDTVWYDEDDGKLHVRVGPLSVLA